MAEVYRALTALVKAQHKAETTAERPELFAPYQPFPGVLPAEERDRPLLAQDSAPIVASTWANQSVYSGSWFEGEIFPGFAFLAQLLQRPEYRVMSEIIASEMTREWIEIKSTGDDETAKAKADKIAKIEDEFERLKVKQAFAKAAWHDGGFGRGHIYLEIGDDTDNKDELKISIGDGREKLSQGKVTIDKPLRALRNVEPVWAYPTQYDSVNPLKGDWYKPVTWYVMSQEVHRTRFLTFIGREVPDLLKPAYAFGGLSMSQMAKPYVDNWLRIRQSIADLIQAFSVMVLKTDMQAMMQTGGDDMAARIQLFNALRANNGVMALNKDSEEFDNVSAPLAGLDALQAQSQEHQAAVSRIPLVKLLGITPSGLNASSEGEIRAFYDWIAAYQELLFGEHLTTVLGFVQLSLFGEVDDEITFDFKPLWQLDEAARVSVEKTKTDIDDANVAMGAISPEEARQRLANDDESQYAALKLGDTPPPEPEVEEDPFDPTAEPGNENDPHAENPNVPKPRDPHDHSEATAARAGNLQSVTGGFGGDKVKYAADMLKSMSSEAAE